MKMSTILVLGLAVVASSYLHVSSADAVDFGMDIDDDKIWLFHVSLWGLTKQYINNEGAAAGFDIDVLNAVCKIAGKNCRTVHDIQTNCWQSVPGEMPRGGTGIMAGWYDGCLGWRNSVDRRRVFDFSDEFVTAMGQVFVTKAGNPGGFDYQDLTGKKVGFVDGFASNEQCVASKYADEIIGADIPTENVVHCQGITGCIEELTNDEFDMLFLATTAAKGRPEIEIISPELEPCTAGGMGLFVRKDSRVLEWFQPALRKLMSSGEYKDLCDNIDVEHGDQPGRNGDEMCFKTDVAK